MTDGSPTLDLSVDRLVLDGLDLPVDAAASLGQLIESELRRIFAGGAAAASLSASPELEPIVLADPPDVPALARALAERIAGQANLPGGWDG